MHKLESSNNLTISQQFTSISNYCTYLNLYKQVPLQISSNTEDNPVISRRQGLPIQILRQKPSKKNAMY